MSDLRQAAQQALEFCGFLWREVAMNDYAEEQRERVESALRAALEAPKPLTDHALWANDDLMSVNAEVGFKMQDIIKIARAIERAHGITGGRNE